MFLESHKGREEVDCKDCRMESCIVIALVLPGQIHKMVHILVGKLHQEDEVQALDIHPSLLA